MWGDDLLIYPKLTAPPFDWLNDVTSHIYPIEVELPT